MLEKGEFQFKFCKDVPHQNDVLRPVVRRFHIFPKLVYAWDNIY